MTSKRVREESVEDWMLVLDDFIDNDHHESGHNGDAIFESKYSNAKELIGHEVCDSKSKQSVSVLGIIENSEPMDEENTVDEEKKQLRCERKRNRERQRRNNVNVNFSRLSDLLKRVEESDLDSDVSDDEDETQVRKKKSSGTASAAVNTPANRVDLIARSIEILDRLHQVNKSLRSTVKDTRRQLKKTQVLVDKTFIPNTVSRQQFVGGAMEGNTTMNNPFGGLMMMMPNMNMMQPSMDGRQQQPMMMMVPMMMPNQIMSGIHHNSKLGDSQESNQPSGLQRIGNQTDTKCDTDVNDNYQTPPFQNVVQHNMMGMFHPMPLMNGPAPMNPLQASSMQPQMNPMMNSSAPMYVNRSGSQSHQHGQHSDHRRYKGNDEGSSYGGNLAHCA